MTSALALTKSQLVLPWRDPHTVSPARLSEYIAALEDACRQHPRSAGLRTVLGIAYAMNYDVYRSMDALEEAVRLDPGHFFAQFKYAELLFRIRTLHRAEEETLKSLELAENTWHLSLARAQLKEIRRILRKGHERPALDRAFATPAVAITLAAIMIGLALLLR
jgi:tetratricopeptide (TPR) repeat protein